MNETLGRETGFSLYSSLSHCWLKNHLINHDNSEDPKSSFFQCRNEKPDDCINMFSFQDFFILWVSIKEWPWECSPALTGFSSHFSFFSPKSEFQNYIDTFPVTQAVKFSVWAWIVFHCKWWDITEVEMREKDYPNFGICLSLWLIPETLQMCSCYKIFYDAAPASLQGVRFLKGSEREILERESAIK